MLCRPTRLPASRAAARASVSRAARGLVQGQSLLSKFVSSGFGASSVRERERREAESSMATRLIFFTFLIDGRLTGLGAATDAADAPDDAPAALWLPPRRRSIRTGGGGGAPRPPPRPPLRPQRSPILRRRRQRAKSDGRARQSMERAFSCFCGSGEHLPYGPLSCAWCA